MQMLKNYKELKVWQKSCELCLEIYTITEKSPREQRYGLTSQTRRSVVSIPSNTAEGYGRKSCWRWTLKGNLFKRQKKEIKRKTSNNANKVNEETMRATVEVMQVI